MAEHAENRKTKEVNDRWDTSTNPNVSFVPFAIEVSGGFGRQAHHLIREMLDIPSAPDPNKLDRDSINARVIRSEKLDAFNRIKASIVAAVWFGNHLIFTAYIQTLKSKQASGVNIVGQNQE